MPKYIWYCGCCGGDLDHQDDLWCQKCKWHVAQGPAPDWERTYSAWSGKPCPFSEALTEMGNVQSLEVEFDECEEADDFSPAIDFCGFNEVLESLTCEPIPRDELEKVTSVTVRSAGTFSCIVPRR